MKKEELCSPLNADALAKYKLIRLTTHKCLSVWWNPGHVDLSNLDIYKTLQCLSI